MNKAKFVSAAALCLSMSLLVGCGDKKVDGSSQESFSKSVQSVAESLPDAKKQQFAIALVQGQTIGIHAKGQTFAQAVDGKTADEVIVFVKQGIEEKTTLKW